jgi:SAM-dependent methyltransferase
MPFRDKAFDFVITFHVLEHVPDPAAFLQELQRVGKAGYIETPNAIFERLVPYDIHLLEIMNINNTLMINKKASARPDRFLNELELLRHSAKWNRFFYGNPELFHVRYFWNENINFHVGNPDVSLDWFVDPETPEMDEDRFATHSRPNSLRSAGLAALRKWYKVRKKNGPDLVDLLVCPHCHGELTIDESKGSCTRCRVSYQWYPVPDFNRPINFDSESCSRKRAAEC